MNDFHAAPIDWAEFLTQFEATQLGPQLQQAKDNRDTEEAMSLAQDFLNPWLWERPVDGDAGFPVTISFKGLGVVASLYPEIRAKLDEETRSALDALLAPFAGQWMEAHIPPQPALDLPEDMKLLAYGALSVALPPESCERLASMLRTSSWQPKLAAVLGGHDDTKTFEAVVTELAELILAATEKRAGVISVYEI